jgi:hypothetical protein
MIGRLLCLVPQDISFNQVCCVCCVVVVVFGGLNEE